MMADQIHVEVVSQDEDGGLVIKLSPELTKLLVMESAPFMKTGDLNTAAELADHAIRSYPFSRSLAYDLGWEEKEHWGRRWAKR